jgi:predicted permease
MAVSLGGFGVTARTLRKQSVFTSVVVLSLALAIAVNTTMYSMLDALMHPRLDMKDPASLYWIRFYGDFKNVVGNRERDQAIASGLHGVEAVTRAQPMFGRSFIERGQTIIEGGALGVGENYFDLVRPRIIAGRTFRAADVQAAEQPAVISEQFAAILFPKGELPINERITVNRIPYTVIGVISDASNFPTDRQRLWLLAPFENKGTYQRLIRLRRGTSVKDAERELAVIAAHIAQEAGEAESEVAFRFHQAADPEFQVRGLHYALLFAVGAVLLVACANLANLQLARGISRRRDLALRSALGATRGRLVGHLLRESVLLAAGGLATGLLLTWLAGHLMRATIPPSMGGYVVAPVMSVRVILFAIVATIVCLFFVGLAPSLYVSRADPSEALKAGAGTGATRTNRRKYGALVGVEIALALALTSGAVLTVRSALRASQLGTGFDPAPLVTGMVGPVVRPRAGMPYSEMLQSAAARVKTIKGVTEAAATTSFGTIGGAVTVEDPGGVREKPAPNFGITMVSPSYFRTLRRPVVRGRDFIEGERDEGAVIIDEQTARVLWPNANPVGAQIKFGESKSVAPYVRVVGVVGEQDGFRSDPNLAIIMRQVNRLGRIYYLPGPRDTLDGTRYGPLSITARTDGNAQSLATTIARAFFDAGDYRTFGIASMDNYLGVTRARQSSRFISGMFSLFAALGVALAAFGVYGVAAHSVAERRRELGVRIALGATSRDILHAVLRESATVVLLGVAFGLLCTKYGVRLLGNLAIEDDFFNAGLFAVVALALAATAVTAAMVPALRATRVDPTESLRND